MAETKRVKKGHGYVVSKCNAYGELEDGAFFLTKKDAEDFVVSDVEREKGLLKELVKGSRMYQDGDLKPVLYVAGEDLSPIQWLITRVDVPNAA